MEHFAKMIYEQWFKSEAGENFCWGDEYEESWKKLYDILNEKIAHDIECSINKRVWEVQEKSFIEGFAYACKCLSNGTIEIGRGK
jgi:hypothetical protein